MFSILRFILIVGAIFYYSPVRQKGEGTAALDALLTAKTTEPASAAAAPANHSASETSGHLENVWQALPNGAKQAVIDKILTTSGLIPAENAPTDTLQPEDRQPAWKSQASKPRT
jgi:hypothetical protein